MLFYKQQIQTKQLSKQKKLKIKQKNLVLSNLLSSAHFLCAPLDN